MQTIVATRTELLSRRRQSALAAQGRDLLVDKRTALTRAFTERSAVLARRLRELAASAADARGVLDDTIGDHGVAPVRSAAIAAAGTVPVRLESSVVAGVPVVDVETGPVVRTDDDRGFAPELVPTGVEDTARAYEEHVRMMLEIAPLELSVRRLGAEIAKTTRQVNGLEQVVMPRLREEARAIALALDEREREEVARLKRARSRLRDAEDRS